MCSVNSSRVTCRDPLWRSSQTACESNSERRDCASAHSTKRDGPCGSPSGGLPSPCRANVPSSLRTTSMDAPRAAMSNGCTDNSRRDFSGSIENETSDSRRRVSPASPAALPPSTRRTSSTRSTGVQPRQYASIAPSRTSRSNTPLTQPSISGRRCRISGRRTRRPPSRAPPVASAATSAYRLSRRSLLLRLPVSDRVCGSSPCTVHAPALSGVRALHMGSPVDRPGIEPAGAAGRDGRHVRRRGVPVTSARRRTARASTGLRPAG